MWCDNCGDGIEFFSMEDGPNGEFLCRRCSNLPEYQETEDDDDV